MHATQKLFECYGIQGRFPSTAVHSIECDATDSVREKTSFLFQILIFDKPEFLTNRFLPGRLAHIDHENRSPKINFNVFGSVFSLCVPYRSRKQIPKTPCLIHEVAQVQTATDGKMMRQCEYKTVGKGCAIIMAQA